MAPHILNLVIGQGGVTGSWEDPSTHWIWVCSGHRSCLDNGEEKKSLSARNGHLVIQALAWSLFWLSYPGLLLYLLKY